LEDLGAKKETGELPRGRIREERRKASFEMEGHQKRRWERLRKLLRLLVGRRKRRKFSLPENSATTSIPSLKEERAAEASLPPESARLATLSPSNDLLANLTKFRLSTAASRETLVPQVDELEVFNRPMPLDHQLSVPGVSREPGLTLESQRLEKQMRANGLAEQRWRAGSTQCLANLNSWPSRLSLVE